MLTYGRQGPFGRIPSTCWVFDSTVECCFNAAQHNMIFHTVLHWLKQHMNKNLLLQRTSHSSPWRASYGVSFMRIWEKTDHVIKAPHCIFQLFLDLKGESIAVTLSRPSVLLHTSNMQPMTLKVKAGQLWETGSSIAVTSPRLDHQFYMQQAN